MTIINLALEKTIQTSITPPSLDQIKNINSWLEAWVTFCNTALTNGLLANCHHAIIDEQLAQREAGFAKPDNINRRIFTIMRLKMI